jgi:hypothetical protein
MARIDGHPRRDKLDRFIRSFTTNFESLLKPMYHSKWREIDLVS